MSADLNGYGGNVYTIIISLRREDAERLGFDNGSRWRDMLRTQTQALAENLKIPMEHLKWFAAFHNESHHPHVHLLAYSTVKSEGYLTKRGVHNLRSEFAKDIFAQDLHCVYEQQTEYRDELRKRSKEKAAKLLEQINSGLVVDPQLKQMLVELSRRLKRHKGKKVYGYLSAGTKKLVDNIVDQLAQDSRISALYDLWYRQRDEIFKTYSSAASERVPLSQNLEFKKYWAYRQWQSG
ncbi:MobP3 family relaxase [Oscillospiraceae bacterium 42-9]